MNDIEDAEDRVNNLKPEVCPEENHIVLELLFCEVISSELDSKKKRHNEKKSCFSNQSIHVKHPSCVDFHKMY